MTFLETSRLFTSLSTIATLADVIRDTATIPAHRDSADMILRKARSEMEKLTADPIITALDAFADRELAACHGAQLVGVR